MTSRDFCYWLQGWFEINETIGQIRAPRPETLDMIKNHLSLVFIHEIDPSMGNKEHQEKLNDTHKPTLQELGEEHGFEVQDISYEDGIKHGNQPFPGWKLSTLHGWYDPKEGVPRC